MDNAELESFIYHSQLMELMDKSGCDLTLDVRFISYSIKYIRILGNVHVCFVDC